MYFRCYVNILLIKYTNVNFTSLYLKKAGLASRNIAHLIWFGLLPFSLLAVFATKKDRRIRSYKKTHYS